LAASYWFTESLRCLTILSSTVMTAASSSSMRSSTSLCLIAALIRRITPRECLSPPFMAAFMSSVSCCFRLMDHLLRDRECRGRGWNPGTQKAGHARACRLLLRCGRPGPPSGSRVRSVQALTLGDVARGTAQLALHGSCGLALAFL